jgi:FG-GAP-like repeat
MRTFLLAALAATVSVVAFPIAACGGGDGGGASSGASGSGGSSGASGSSGTSGAPREDAGSTFPDGSVAPTSACKAAGGTAKTQPPTFVRNIKSNETGWFSSPLVVDLDGDGKKEIVAPFYSTFVFDAAGKQLGKGTATQGRVYAPAVVADIDKDGTTEIVVAGNAGTVAAYTFKAGALAPKWTASTNSGGDSPEARGMAAADLDGDGTIEIVVTTTNTASDGAQVFVFDGAGKVYQPAGTAWAAWPRYNTLTGPGGDKDFNGQGNQGYGCYGENVGIGNLDDDPEPEIVTTYDNHQINVFNRDGTSVLASSFYTNPSTQYLGKPMGWGQFIRWFDPKVENDHYNGHTDPWPDVKTTMWLQWTASPPNVVDVNGDGKNDVVGIPNAEMHDPYETQGYAFMVLEGAFGDGSRAARRLAGFDTLPMSDKPVVRAADDYYPPSGIPAATTVSILGDAKPEILAPINDGFIYAIGPDGARLWRYDFAKGAPKTFASEVTVADLNKDGSPEIVFGTYSLQANGGHLIVLANTGELLYDVVLPGQGTDGNGIGIPAAPAIADLDGDGQLEIVVMTFDHGLDVFTVPGSGTDCVLWSTGRGGHLRTGSPN